MDSQSQNTGMDFGAVGIVCVAVTSADCGQPTPHFTISLYNFLLAFVKFGRQKGVKWHFESPNYKYERAKNIVFMQFPAEREHYVLHNLFYYFLLIESTKNVL